MGFTKLFKTAFFGLALAALVALVSGLAGYSGCNGGAQKSLTITAPENDATISPADDVSDTSGIQINVTAAVEGFARGDLLYLRMVDASGFETARRFKRKPAYGATSREQSASPVQRHLPRADIVTAASPGSITCRRRARSGPLAQARLRCIWREARRLPAYLTHRR